MDHEEDMDMEQKRRMVQYISGLDEIIVSNTIREARDRANKELAMQQAGGKPPQMRMPGPAQPMQDVIQQNAKP